MRERWGRAISGSCIGAISRRWVGEVAVKVIRPEFVNRAEFVRLLRSGSPSGGPVGASHIVPLYDYWTPTGLIW